jgi:hypothetical protein
MPFFRAGFEQMVQLSPSEMLPQRLQVLISRRSVAITSLNRYTSSGFCFSRCNTKRSAVFFPIPGRAAKALTAFSSKTDGNCMAQR